MFKTLEGRFRKLFNNIKESIDIPAISEIKKKGKVKNRLIITYVCIVESPRKNTQNEGGFC